MKDERKIILKNQITVEELMKNVLPNTYRNTKPFLVMTLEGDYYFETKEDAQKFARARNGFVVHKKSYEKEVMQK